MVSVISVPADPARVQTTAMAGLANRLNTLMARKP
jgi:hypothetical protein